MAEHGDPSANAPGIHRADLAVGIAVFAIAMIVGWNTQLIAGSSYATVGPAVFPWIATVMLAGLGLVLVAQALRGGWSENDAEVPFDRGSFAWLAAGLVINAAAIEAAGFIIASTVMFVCVARAFGSRSSLRDLAIGAALTSAAYVGFDRVLGYRIGSGLIESLI